MKVKHDLVDALEKLDEEKGRCADGKPYEGDLQRVCDDERKNKSMYR